MKTKIEEIREAVGKVGNWRIAGYGGEHDETGASIRDDKTGELIASTASIYSSDRQWDAYYAKANLVANAPAYIRYLLSVIDGEKV